MSTIDVLSRTVSNVLVWQSLSVLCTLLSHHLSHFIFHVSLLVLVCAPVVIPVSSIHARFNPHTGEHN